MGHELHPAVMDQAVTRLQTCGAATRLEGRLESYWQA